MEIKEIEVGDVIYQGDSEINIVDIIGENFIGIDYSFNHGNYTLVCGNLKKYKEEYGYEIGHDSGYFEETNEEFMNFLEG